MLPSCSPEGRGRAIKVRSNLDGTLCVVGSAEVIHRITVSTSYLFPIKAYLFWECDKGSVERISPYDDPVTLDLDGGGGQKEAPHEWRLTKSQTATPGPSQLRVRVEWRKVLTSKRVSAPALLAHPLIYNITVQ